MQKRNPIAKAILCMAFLVVGLFIAYPMGYFVLLGMLVFIAIFGKFPAFIKVFVSTLVPISFFIVLMQGLFAHGADAQQMLWQWGNYLHFSMDGVYRGLRMVNIITLAGSSLLMFFNLVEIKDLMLALEQKGMPPRATFIVLASFQMVNDLGSRAKMIIETQQARGIEVTGSLKTRLKAYMPMISPLIISSIARIEEQVITLESRGFTVPVKKTRIHRVSEDNIDKLIIYCAWLAMGLAIGWRLWSLYQWLV